MGAVFWMSLVMSIFGCTGFILVGKGKWYGWALNLAAQPVWMVFSIVTHGYALLISSLLYTVVFVRNLRIALNGRRDLT